MKNTNEIASPCVANCCLDQQDICVGCYRSLDEILNWQASNKDQRLSVLSRIALRKTKKNLQGIKPEG